MDSLKAFAIGRATRGKEPMVFDWDKAARIIRERGAQSASAGLRDDWEWTGGVILSGGKPYTEDYTYLASTWAVPELEVDGKIIDCYRMKSEVPEWDCATKWPASALAILNAEK